MGSKVVIWFGFYIKARGGTRSVGRYGMILVMVLERNVIGFFLSILWDRWMDGYMV